jgi:hypothetical protein
MTESGFVFRRKVPPSLRSRIGRVEIIRALRTHSRTLAKLRARRMWLQTEGLFHMLRTHNEVVVWP